MTTLPTPNAKWLPDQFISAGDTSIASDQIAFARLTKDDKGYPTLYIRLKGEDPMRTPHPVWEGKDAEIAWEQIQRPIIFVDS